MEIEELGLVEPALGAARKLKQAHPAVVFTSGVRKIEDQARAMAQNIARNRNWIAETYLSTPQSRALQAWVDANPGARTQTAIQAGLASVMQGWTQAQLGKLSKHFLGLAFDVQPLPPGAQADAIKAAIRALPGLTKFLEREGGLVRWHAQFG